MPNGRVLPAVTVVANMAPKAMKDPANTQNEHAHGCHMCLFFTYALRHSCHFIRKQIVDHVLLFGVKLSAIDMENGGSLSWINFDFC